MDQFFPLVVAFLSGFIGNLMAVKAKYPTTWKFFCYKSKTLYSQTIIHGFLSGLIFYILIAIINIQITISQMTLQNDYVFAVIIGLISQPLYNYEFFLLPLEHNNKKFSISSLIPIVNGFGADLDLEIYSLVRKDVDIKCAYYYNFDNVKKIILQHIPPTNEGTAFKDDIEEGKYSECWAIMYDYAQNFGKDLLDSIFPVPIA
jgi:hypothetical protein